MILEKLLTFVIIFVTLVTALLGVLLEFTSLIDGLDYIHFVVGGVLVLLVIVRLYMMMPKSKSKK